MADRKGGQGELVGVEDGEERREGELVGRWVEDSGTESGEERKGVEEAMEQVKGALEKLASALPRLAGNLGGSVNDLVAKLQNCLVVPAPPPRKNRRRHHTVGVTPEEIARARKWADKPKPISLSRGEFKHVEQKAGYSIEPQPLSAVVSFNASPGSTAPPLNYDPSASLFTPAQSVQIAVHKAAIQKQISQEEIKVRKTSLQRQMSQEELRKKETDSDSSSDEGISPARRLLKIASKRRTRITKIKRSNTVEITRPATYCDSDTDDPAYGSDRSGLKRKSAGSLYPQPPPFLPKTDNDLKFLDFLSKVTDSSGNVASYNPSARGGKHWSNRFSKIKTSFEDHSSDEKEVIPKGKCSPFPQQKSYVQPKLPWSVKQEGDVVVGSITVAKKASGPVNQFTHAPMSPFKPVEKKIFPSSVSGSVKQLASQKFAPPVQQEIIKPIPSVPPRTHSKFQPLPCPDAPPLSQRFVPNKVSGVQHPPVQAYLNQFSHSSPKSSCPSNEVIPIKTPNKNVNPKPNHPVNINPVFKNEHNDSDFASHNIQAQPLQPNLKPEIPAKPILKFSNSANHPSKPALKLPKSQNEFTEKPLGNYHQSKQNLVEPSKNYHLPLSNMGQDLDLSSGGPIINYNATVEQGVHLNANCFDTYNTPSVTNANRQKVLDNSNKSMDMINANVPSKLPEVKLNQNYDLDSPDSLIPQPVSFFSEPILEIPDSINDSSYSSFQKHSNHNSQDKGEFTKPSSNYNSSILSLHEPTYPNKNALSANYNGSWGSESINQTTNALSVPEERRSSESLSPYPYKGCYVYNENNEILATSPYSFSSNPTIHATASPSYVEPVYQNLLEINNSPAFLHPPTNTVLGSFQQVNNNLSVNCITTPEKSPLPHQYTDNSVTYPNQYDNRCAAFGPQSGPKIDSSSYYKDNLLVFEPVNPSALSYQHEGSESKNASNYFSDSGKGSHDSLNELNFQGNYPLEYHNKAPCVVYNNCINSKRGLNEPLERFSPSYGNLSGVNNQGDSSKSYDDWDNCIEEKAVVGRVMGEAQCQRATTQTRRVESRFPNAPSGSNLLRPPSDQAIKVPSPTLKSRQDQSPKALSPSFPNVLHKSESWHQMVKEQMSQAKQAPPIPAKVVKTKSSHTLAMPKQFEGALNPDSAQRLQNTVKQYLSKSPMQKESSRSPSNSQTNDEIENVDEAFESLFQECSKKRNSK